MSVLTTSFEVLSKHILESIYPNFKCELFGTSAHAGDVFHGGTLLDRLCRLAQCLNTRVKDEVIRNPHNLESAGDGGIDLIAYQAIDSTLHPAPFLPAGFGQCACSYDDWITKQNEVGTYRYTTRRFEQIEHFHQLMFVPFPLRNTIGTWDDEYQEQIESLIIDRFRFIDILIKNDDDLSFFTTSAIYQELFDFLKTLMLV
ncbi:MAG: hypothetical protein VB026_08380 [Anaerolineaceae bacterium]|nr:hypothetical protein [Anaerolineaceae bacterium]